MVKIRVRVRLGLELGLRLRFGIFTQKWGQNMFLSAVADT